MGLVLGGGGARGAYASGALSVLLPGLKDQVSVIVGTSAGALISAYLAANWHRPAEEAIDDGLRFWRELRFGDVLAPLMAPGGAARFMRYVGEFLPVSSLHAASILHPEPLSADTRQGWSTSTSWARTSASSGWRSGSSRPPPTATGRSSFTRAGLRDTATTRCAGSSTSRPRSSAPSISSPPPRSRRCSRPCA